MPSFNKAIVMGHVGQDPELRFTPSGKPVCTFSVATSRFYQDEGGENKRETDWHSIVAWGRLAENCNQFLTKGALVLVEGRIQYRSWEGTDGKKRYKTEIVAYAAQFFKQDLYAREGKEAAADEDLEPGDIPF